MLKVCILPKHGCVSDLYIIPLMWMMMLRGKKKYGEKFKPLSLKFMYYISIASYGYRMVWEIGILFTIPAHRPVRSSAHNRNHADHKFNIGEYIYLVGHIYTYIIDNFYLLKIKINFLPLHTLSADW